MAIPTCRLYMSTSQLEDGAIVIEVYGFPAFDRMAGGTVHAEAFLVRIIKLVAGETILFGRL